MTSNFLSVIGSVSTGDEFPWLLVLFIIVLIISIAGLLILGISKKR